MKSVLLYLVAPLITFTLGVATNRLLTKPPVVQTPPQPIVERLTDIPAPVAQSYAPAPQAQSEAAPIPTFILDYPKNPVGISGTFYIMGKKPKEFADFNFIEVYIPGDRDVNTASISVLGEFNEVWNSFNASFTLVTEQKLFFVTSKGTESDFEYRFEGEFVRTDFEKVANKNVEVLRGTLTKTKDGRKIAERKFSFHLEQHGC